MCGRHSEAITFTQEIVFCCGWLMYISVARSSILTHGLSHSVTDLGHCTICTDDNSKQHHTPGQFLSIKKHCFRQKQMLLLHPNTIPSAQLTELELSEIYFQRMGNKLQARAAGNMVLNLRNVLHKQYHSLRTKASAHLKHGLICLW